MDGVLIHGAHKRYRRVHALRGVELEIPRGEVLGLLGPNGAGKSTLVKSMCGLVRLSSGSMLVFGAPAGSRAARQRIGYLAELFRFPSWLTCREVLAMHQRLARSEGGVSEQRALLKRVGLAHAADRRVAALSKGMQQRLGLAQALIGTPELLILDEPTSALDPEGRLLVRRVVEEQRAAGCTIVLSSHLLAEVEHVCDSVAVVAHGKLVASGPLGQLVRDVEPRVRIVTEAGEQTTRCAHQDVPDLVAQLVASGERILQVEPLHDTLEAAYLRAISEGGSDA